MRSVPPVPTSSAAQWGLVSTLSQQEVRASEHIARQGGTPYHPRTRVEVPVRGRLVGRTVPLFPGYLFVMLTDSWHYLRGTRGVAGLVMSGDRPAVLRRGEVEALRASEIDGLVVPPGEVPPPPVNLQPGQYVLVDRGNGALLEGVFRCRTARGRVSVLLSILGGERLAEVDEVLVLAA